MLGENVSRRHFEIFFLYVEKIGLTFHANCLLKRHLSPLALNVKSYYLGKIRKHIINLSSAEFALSTVTVITKLVIMIKAVLDCRIQL